MATKEVKEELTVEDVSSGEEDIETSPTPKPKRAYTPRPPKTEAQMEAFKKAIETRNANAKKRKEEAEKMLAQSKKETEDKVVKKAIAIKKKQIKAQLALDEISDDEEPIEVVKQKVKKVVERPPPKPVFIFV
jgi:hypothetical protein